MRWKFYACKYFEKCLENEICMSPAKLYMGVKMQVNSGTLCLRYVTEKKKAIRWSFVSLVGSTKKGSGCEKER